MRQPSLGLNLDLIVSLLAWPLALLLAWFIVVGVVVGNGLPETWYEFDF